MVMDGAIVDAASFLMEYWLLGSLGARSCPVPWVPGGAEIQHNFGPPYILYYNHTRVNASGYARYYVYGNIHDTYYESDIIFIHN